MRCLALAAKLITAGAEVCFICRELPGNLCATINDSWGFSVYRLPHNPGWAPQPARNEPDETTHAVWLEADWQDDAGQTALAISSQLKGADWLVVDHYALDARWEAALRPSTRHLMVIDDLADRSHECDVLLDQNLHRDLSTRYDNLIPSHCQRLLGPRYALLRQEFGEARAKLRVRDGVVRRLLIFFGGIDTDNETSKALEAVKTLNQPDIEVDVIVGAASPNLENIRSICAGLPHACLHYNPNNIAELIGNADLAIGATGATSWERCCLGLPSIVISLAMNQESIAHALTDGGLAIYLGKRTAVTAGMITAAVEELMRNPDRMKAMSSACAALLDGHGTERVARALDMQPIVLRPAHIGDCESLHQWRNAEETRRHSHRPDTIPLQQHQQWLNDLLRDPERVLLIGERDHQPIGVLRYDCEAPRCTVSIYLVPGQHGHGYGPRLLRAGHEWLQQHRRDVMQVRAEVLESNRASADTFLQAGYRRQDNIYIKNLD
jgi:UDP-2,4-diacetamido-2,4,6-trideoxy-beta-L-altropyranose hydrolase